MTGRTNSTNKGREEASSKKVGNAKTQFGRKMDADLCSGEGNVVAEKGERQTSTQGSAWGK